MEENILEVNETFLGTKGAIGRHTFFLNLVKVWLISIILLIPYSVASFLNADSFFDMFGGINMFWKVPLVIRVITFISFVIITSLFIPSLIRRLNDINGKVNKTANIIFSVFSALACCYIFPGIIDFILTFSFFIMLLVLLIKKGKVTNDLPYDYKKEFNWGAFFGTWIWGAANKSFATFWSWLLWWTPLIVPFKLYCGLKGNEWAYKNKKWDNVEEFNKNQRKHTTIFTILSLIVFPVIKGIILFFILMVFVFFAAQEDANEKYSKIGVPQNASASNTKLDKFESGMDKFSSFLAYSYFEDYEITEDENKFYVLPNDWRFATYSDKKDMLDLGSLKAATYRTKVCKMQGNSNCPLRSRQDELRRTKIYNYETHQLLGEYNPDTATPDSFQDAMKSAFSAYKFYKVEK